MHQIKNTNKTQLIKCICRKENEKIYGEGH